MTLRRSGGRVLEAVSRIGADPHDSADLRQRKASLVLVSMVVIPPAAIWSAIYLAAGQPVAAALPLAYLVFSLGVIAAFARTRSYGVLRTGELVAILVTPFVLGVALGGLVASSAVILWSLLAVFGAIAFDEPRRGWTWFAAFLALLLVTTPVTTLVKPAPAILPDALILAFLTLNVGTVSLIAFFVLTSFAGQREEARARADALLLNILPAEIAEALKTEHRQIARGYEQASVLFADVVDFTPMSSASSPARIVDLLDGLFSEFDELVDRHGVEKIKTIGDAYMAAAGVPHPRGDHAQAIVALALEIVAAADHHRREDGTPIRLRVGIESGPVVAGVIGRRKFIYDLWGNTVNIASRMESHGVPGRVQVGEGTYRLIADDFVCEPRGEVEIKGKGTIRTWFVIGPRPPRA